MAIPTYEEIMLPLLKLVSDGRKYQIADAADCLAKEYNLSNEECEEWLPSGRQKKFQNRVHWARFYLIKAGLLKSPERAHIEITQRGIEVLEDNPKEINNRFLNRFEEFSEFIKKVRKNQDLKSEPKIGDDAKSTPEEVLESSYNELYESLINEMLERIKSMSPEFFEKLVVELLLKMGYGGSRQDAGKAIGRSHDGGIDGIIKEDKLGLDIIYIQAKRWENTVGRPIVQAFAGSLDGVRAKRGILITTSHFSSEAHDYVENIEKKIVLIDGEMLCRLMIDNNLAVTVTTTYEIKKMDTDYFLED